MERPCIQSLIVIFTIIIIVMSSVNVSAQSAGPTAKGSQYDINDPAGLKAFIDELMPEQMKENNVPGGAIAVVKDGHIIYTQGYGYSDMENHTPVIADQTLFRIGSVTKLFTATAVMQLVEQGKLDLNADVNVYLKDFKIPDTYPEPITLNDLLTHMAGFEDQSAYGKIIVISPDKYGPLGDYLAHNMPARVRPPGEVAAYSNYGMALAGYIVEQVSGVPYDRYIEQNILLPLDMKNSTAAQPVPYGLKDRLSEGYTYSGGLYTSVPFEYIRPSPAGSISSTSTDMANFMIAQLDEGRLGNASVMNATTAENMQSRHFAGDPRLNGMAYGFQESEINGKKILEHGGATTLFICELCLVPSEKLGIFMAFNSGGGVNARAKIIQAFFDRYYPAPAQAPIQPMAGYQERAQHYVAVYSSTSMSYTTNEKIVGGLTQQYGIKANDNGTINLLDKNYVEVEPLLFQELNGTGKLAFREDDKGNIEYVFADNAPAESLVKEDHLYQTAVFHLLLLLLCLAIFLSAPVVWAAAWLRSRRRKTPATRKASMAKWLSSIVCILNVAFILGFALVFILMLNELAYDAPLALYLVLAIPIVTSILTIGVIAYTAYVWLDKDWRLPGKVYYTVVTLAMLAFIWLLNYWNLLGYKM